MIKKLFIANRGEIACRIAQTAHRLEIAVCGVYTPQDARSKHVRILDQVRQLPAGDLSENYLNANLLIACAREFEAEAIHPGYGFLAENPEFAEKIREAGLIWVGPDPAAMRLLGDKVSAKDVAARAGVPVAPWTRITGDPSPEEIQAILNQIGLPALIKAAHGGGGRGQRIVKEASQFTESLRTARSESLRSFGSAEVFVERFLERPRHIEVQILADAHGHVFTLGERDCTVQRRNQKVIEESPAAILDPITRTKIHTAARSLAMAVGYTNAGTIEFLAQQNESGTWEFFFMELNARLQVEHPVTEMLRSIDLVELQLRAACGENLEPVLSSLPPEPQGHAIEVRLCAENPANRFLPTPGPITQWILPAGNTFRIDSGFEEGDVIAQEYDSLFAKVIVKAADRKEAIRKITNVLEGSLIGGIITNKTFLQSVLQHPDFQENRIFTRWIDSHPELTNLDTEKLDRDLIYWGKRLSSELYVQRRPANGLRLAPPADTLTGFIPMEGVHGEPSPHGLIRLAGNFELKNGSCTYASGWISRFELCVSFLPAVEGISQRRLMFAGLYEIEDLRTHHGPIIAQVPGIVLDVRAQTGAVVAAHEPVLVVEAMKIEMPMSLPIAARITNISVKIGDRIQPGQTLVTWDPAE